MRFLGIVILEKKKMLRKRIHAAQAGVRIRHGRSQQALGGKARLLRSLPDRGRFTAVSTALFVSEEKINKRLLQSK